jgi:DNA-binding transcriptional LysR family regulator
VPPVKKPELAQLEVLAGVVEAKGFSRAAARLGLSQPTISFHLKALEATVGVRLVERKSGQVRATAAGRLLIRYGERMLKLRDEALESVADEATGRTGHLRIAASSVPGEWILPGLLSRFRVKHPHVRVTAWVSDSRKALARLLAEDCELALVGAVPKDRRLEARAFAEDAVVAVTAPGRERHTELPLILRAEGSGTRAAASIATARRVDLEVDSMQVAKQCALAGLGLTVISRRAVQAELAARTLRLVAVPGLPVRRRFYAARLKAAQASGAAEAFWRQL